MYHLETIIPWLKGRKLPLSRDQFMLLMVAVNEIILGVDIFLAHSISGTIVPYEWIPIIFGPAAGILLLAAGLIALRKRNLATILAALVFFASILVGVLGSYFHIRRSFPLAAEFSQIITVDLMIWAPPLFGPITFAGIGVLGLSAAWLESPMDSGVLKLLGKRTLKFPYPKTNGYLILVSLGMLGTLISSVLDHARKGFENPWLWLPTFVGIFALAVTAALGFKTQYSRDDLWVFVTAMGLMIVVGLIGTGLHIATDLTTDFQCVQERFFRGAPFMAPLNFANMALLGMISLLDPKESE